MRLTKKQLSVNGFKLVNHILLIALGLTMAVPFLWMLSTALKDPGEVFLMPPRWLPRQDQAMIDGQWQDVDMLTRKPAVCEVRFVDGPKMGNTELMRDYRLKGDAGSQWVWELEGEDRVKRSVEIVETQEEASMKIMLGNQEMRWVSPSEHRQVVRFRWGNFRHAWRIARLGVAYFNSTLIVIIVTFGQVLTSAMAAYSFSRLKWRGRDKVFFIYLGTLMIPGAVTMIPVFILMKNLGWVDSYLALIIPPMFSAYGTFMLRQFFLGLPAELEQAARIDGCGYIRIFWHVILPLSKPALATLSIFTFMGNWRSFLWPLIILHSPEKRTLPLSLMAFQGEYGTDWTAMMAASLLAIIPILVVFIAGQRFFVKGIQLGAVKG